MANGRFAGQWDVVGVLIDRMVGRVCENRCLSV